MTSADKSITASSSPVFPPRTDFQVKRIKLDDPAILRPGYAGPVRFVNEGDPIVDRSSAPLPSMDPEPSRALSATEAVMCGWALEQLAPWLLRPVPAAEAYAEWKRLAATVPDLFIFSLNSGKVTIETKGLPGEERSDLSGADRAECYRQYFEFVTRYLPSDFRMVVAVFVGDGALEHPEVPVLSFQKPAGNASILLPDPDMIGRGFPAAHDQLLYDEKLCRAIFVGGTSGGRITSEALAKDGAIPRIRAADYFREHKEVVFRLPAIVQYDTEETASLLRAKGYGDGRTISWDEQLQNRFVLSMDGNGATCTRVSITLGSNSVLMKYESPSNLYYFSGLTPWVHFIPLSEHGDVTKVIAAERRSPGLFRSLPVAANRFATDFLTREATAQYTAYLLQLLATRVLASGPSASGSVAPKITAVAHVQGHGDTRSEIGSWVGVPGSQAWLEGFLLIPQGSFEAADVQYQVIGHDGGLSDTVVGRIYCGTKGAAAPLRGVNISLSAAAASSWNLTCEVRSIDGRTIGPLPGGQMCATVDLAPIEAFRILLTPTEC